MQSRYAKIFQLIIIGGDLLILNFCFFLAGFLRYFLANTLDLEPFNILETDYYDYYIQLFAFFNLSWLLLTLAFGTHQIKMSLEPRKATSKVLNAYFLHIFLLLLLLFISKRDDFSRVFLIFFYSSFLFCILPWRFLFLRILRGYRKKGLNFRNVVLIGDGKGLKKFAEGLDLHPEYGLKNVGYFSNKPIEGMDCSGNEEDFKNNFDKLNVDEIYLAYTEPGDKLMTWYHWADEHLIRFRMIPDFGLIHSQGVQIDFYNEVPVLMQRKEPLEYIHNRILKRAIDFSISILVILLIFPWLFPLLALGVKLSGRGPIFFKQKRTGLQDDDFHIYKFRSMKPNVEADEQQALANDSRFTAFGKIMRDFSLDELPQFINVLKGDMSICGPRPHMLAHTEEYKMIIDRYMVRHFVKPGISGLAQINGYRGEVKNLSDIEGRVKNDVYYIENWSVLLDLKIIILTVWNLLFKK